MVDPKRIIEELNRAGVDFIVIGGIAATLHGCPEQTYDLDILYAANRENRARLLLALGAIGAEWDRPLDDALLQRQPIFALNSRHGDLDIFTGVPGIDSYESAAASAVTLDLNGAPVRALDLTTLIAAKEAAGDPNPRKQSALTYLKALRERRR